MRVAVISANLGSYDEPGAWPALVAPAGVTIDVHRFTDANLLPRPLAMTARLQCGIPKMFGWRIVPGYDAYIWIDASCSPTAITVQWFTEQLGDAEIAVFLHPERRSIREEAEFMLARMARPGETYLTSRYKDELITDQYNFVARDAEYIDDRLFASTAFIYRTTPAVIVMMHEWWWCKSTMCLHDQIVWPYLLWRAGVRVNIIGQSYLRCPALTFTRRTRR